MATKRHTVEIVLNATNKAAGAMGKVTNALGSLGKVAAGLAVGAAAGVAAVAVGIGKLAVDAAQVDTVRQTFDALSASIGETADVMIADLRGATNNMVADADLMQSANQLMSMGLAGNADEAAKLSEMAVRLGAAMGGDAVESMENFALTLANQSLPRLDSFGISASAVRARIGELQDETEGLSREEAFLAAVMEQGTVAMERLGDAGADGAAVKMAQLQATFANLTDNIGSAFLPVLDALLTPLAALAAEHGPAVAQALGRVGEALGFLMEVIAAGGIERLFVSFEDGSNFIGGFVQKLGVSEEAAMRFGEAINTTFDVLTTAAATAWAFIVAQAQTVVTWFQANMPLIQATGQTLADFWTNNLLPALSAAWVAIQAVITGAIDLILGIITAGMQIINGDWDAAWGTIQTTLSGVWETMKTVIAAAVAAIFLLIGVNITDFQATWSNVFEQAKTIFNAFKDAVSAGFDSVKKAVQSGIDAVGDLIDKLKKLKLPDWLTPGSPTPFEMGLRGIANAMRDVNGIGLQAGFNGFAGVGGAGGGGLGGGGGGASIVVNVNNPVISGDMDVEDLAWRISEVIAQRLKVLA